MSKETLFKVVFTRKNAIYPSLFRVKTPSIKLIPMLLRTQAAMLAALLLLPTLASCGGESQNPETTTQSGGTSADVTSAAEENSLDVKDLGKKNFNVLIRTEYTYEFDIAEENGEPVSDAIYRRNQNVSDRYNCTFTWTNASGDWNNHTQFQNLIHSSVMAGDGAYDFVACDQSYLPTNIMNGDLLDLRSLPYLALDEVWWTKEGIEALSLNGRCFMAGGDISLSMLEGIFCMYFNKTVADNFKTPDLYQLVRDGKWTHAKMMEVTKGMYSDLNSSDTADAADRFGITAQKTRTRPFVVTYDTPTIGTDDKGRPSLIWYNDHTVEVVDTLVDTLHGNNDVYFGETADSMNVFTSGNALLYWDVLKSAENLRAMKDDFGIIPYPKFDENQENYLTTSSSISMIAIPVSADDPDSSALVIEALCREAHELVTPAFYERALKGKYARDENSAEMIDFIRSTLTFDFGWVNSLVSAVSGAQYQTMITNGDKNFASYYDSNKTAINKKLSESFEKYYE